LARSVAVAGAHGRRVAPSGATTDVATLLLWELRLPYLARAQMLVLVHVLVGMDMLMVVGPLVVLVQLLVVSRAIFWSWWAKR
jgi:hypothetical protein